MSRVGNAVVAVLCVLLLASLARADGKVFKVLAEDPSAATMPDQQALIHYMNGVETLVIETRFTGNPINFAWVVPLPAPPDVSPATRGLFKTLRAMHQPSIKANYSGVYPLTILVALVVLVGLTKPPRVIRLAVAAAVVFGAALLLLPSLGKARSGMPASLGVDGDSAVTELSREVVGDFEVSVVRSEQPDALVTWLTERGFNVPSAARTVIAGYVADGWCFAAAKMKRDAVSTAAGPITPHPLVFKFPVEAPVYPMRLTGVENGGPLKVDLYVLADKRAAAPGFIVERCGKVEYHDSDYPIRPGHGAFGETVHVSHDWMLKNAPGAAVSTKLVGTLPPSAMTSDVRFLFTDFEAVRRELWSRGAAWERAFDIGFGVATAGLFVLYCVGLVRGWKNGFKPLPALSIIAVSTLVGAVAFTATTTAGATKKGRSYDIYRFQDDVWDAVEARTNAGKPVDEAWLREITAELAMSNAFERHEPPAGMPIEEDSPGNFLLRKIAEGWLLVVYDFYGNEHAFPLQ